MQFIHELIDRFWSGSATKREKKSLLEALQQKEAEMRAQHLEDFYETTLHTDHQRMSASRRRRVLDRGHKRIGTAAAETDGPEINTEGRRVFAMLRVLAAAVLMLALGSIIAIKQFQSSGSNSLQGHMTSEMRSTTNSSARVLSVVLPDESIVHLAPGATIYHTPTFNSDHRDISLEGKARFDVAKKPDLPFRVTSRGYTVKALGTIFLVDATKGDHLQIALLEGKVSVYRASDRPGHEADHILLPGEEFLIDLETQRFDKCNIASGHRHHDPHIQHVPEAALTPSGEKRIVLHFDETPIATVIDQLEVLYGQKIVYDGKLLHGQRFNGRLPLGDGTSIDSLREILSVLLKESTLDYRMATDHIRIIDKQTFKN